MADKPYAFYSNAQVVLDWWAAWKEHEKAHRDALDRIAPEVAPYEGAEPAVIGAWVNFTFDGFIRDWKRDIPDGWKKGGRDGQWILPKLSTKEGKAIQAKMREVPPHVELRRFNGGIPGTKLDLYFGQPPAMSLGETDAWMHFSEDWDNLDAIDPDVWEVRRLSEYYIAAEARRDASGRTTDG